MSDYFVNPEDLGLWVKSKPNADTAASEIIGIIGKGGPVVEENDIKETCRSIFEDKDPNASSTLFGVLAKHNLTKLTKQAQSQVGQSRQRNGWVRGMRNKWNRVVDGFNEGTPWRIDRDKMFNFTHYYTDAITFDEDPNRVYSGEAIWRNYIMDKYSREYQDKDGHWVGGYINNRFYVFPDAGTPANPDVPRDGGNLLGLAPGERTRKPRPHQYSTERRLEEARGEKTIDIEASSVKPIAKIASANLPEERHDDVVYNILRDTIDMREAGFEYEDMLVKISEHYNASLTGVAQIDAFAQKLIEKHSGAFYKLEKTAQTSRTTLETVGDMPIVSNGKEDMLPMNSTVISLGGGKYEAVGHPTIRVFEFVGQVQKASFKNLDAESGGDFPIQDVADDLGLNEAPKTNNAVAQTGAVPSPQDAVNANGIGGEDFPITQQ